MCDDLVDTRGADAILADSDFTAAVLIRALRQRGRRVPEDVAVIGWGNEQVACWLDPPLTMVLDEAAIVAPVPLDRWTADMGGRGVTIHISVQSLAQLRGRWGKEGADTILANVACLLVFGGSVAADDLGDISSITGEHRMKVVGVTHDDSEDDRDGELRGEFRWVPVMSKAQIRALQHGQVLVLRRGLHAVVGWAPKISDRRRLPMVALPRNGAEVTAQLEAMFAQPARTGRAAAVRAATTALLARVRLLPLIRRAASPQVASGDSGGVRTPDDLGDQQDGAAA